MKNSEPIYKVIKKALILELESNKFNKNDPFYSEMDLRKKYTISSTTAVRILNELSNDGYIYRIQGKGSFVSKFNQGTSVKITDTHPYDQNEETTKIIDLNLENHFPDKLNLENNALPVIHLQRLRFFKDVPFEYSISWFAASLFPENFIDNAKANQSIYSVIDGHSNIDMLKQAFTQEYSAINPTEEIQNLLSLHGNTSTVIKIKRKVMRNSACLEFTISYLLPEYFGLKVDNTDQH